MSIPKISKLELKDKKERFADLNFSDIESLNSFKIWLKENLDGIYIEKFEEIPESHLKIFIDYMNKKILDSEEIPKTSKKNWLKNMRKIETTMKKVIENEYE